MQQYLDMKAETPGSVLLFRLGDFYESFFDDAHVVSRALDLVLTKRGTDAAGGDIPMCGIPWHAAENYFARLVRSGFSVAIAEQMESPEEAKARGHKQIERRIIRVLSPGTLTDENLLSPKHANFLVAVYPKDEKRKTKNDRDESSSFVSRLSSFDIAGCDISTGEFFVGELSDNLIDELTRLNPAEVIYPESAAEHPEVKRVRAAFQTTPIYDRIFERKNINDTVRKIFGIENTVVNGAIEILAGYLESTQRGAKISFRAPVRLGTGARLLCDAATWKSLEIDEPMTTGGATLLDVIDRTRTSAGGRKLRAYLRELSGDLDEIRRRHASIGHLILNPDVLGGMQRLLSRTADVGRACARLFSNRGSPRDLRGISDFLISLPLIKSAGVKLDPVLAARFATLNTHDDLAFELKSALADSLPAWFRDGGMIRAGFDAALDNMNRLAHGAKEVIAGLQSKYAADTGIPTLKIKYNNILGYHIEVTSARADKLFADSANFIHRQTMKDNVRFTTKRLIELDNDVRGAADRAAGIEAEIVANLIAKVSAISDDLIATAEMLATVDVWAALAECATEYGWVRPEISGDQTFDVRGGRHPVVEMILRARGDQFVKNDCELGVSSRRASAERERVRDPMDSTVNQNDKDSNPGCIHGVPDNFASQSAPQNFRDDTPGKQCVALLTGPNMSGKSTYLRQNALIVVLAHLGSFVPADAAKIGICDQLFSRVGASDNLAAGQSTFMVEMTETANILKRATKKSFIIFDEIGRGTATFDGLAIAWSVLEFLDKLSPRTLFATHYHELTALASEGDVGAHTCALGREYAPLQHVKNLTVSVAEHNGEIIFMHKIMPGVAASSYGIHVAKMAGMPESVIHRAEAVLNDLENNGVSSRGAPTGRTRDPLESTVNQNSENLVHGEIHGVPGSSASQMPRDDTKVSEPVKKSQMSLF